MRTRPHTKFVNALKSRRCPKCGKLQSNQRVRCKRCATPQGRPKK